MASISTLLEQLFLASIGAFTFVLVIGVVLYRNSWRWRRLAENYAASSLDKPIKRRWTNMIICGLGAWNNYAGITLVGVNASGVTLQLLPPFSFLHRPLFFPMVEVTLVPTRWLFQNAYEIRLRRENELRIVINTATAKWVSSQNNSPRFIERVERGAASDQLIQ